MIVLMPLRATAQIMPYGTSCTAYNLSYDLAYGHSDRNVYGEVSYLQQFLYSKGFLRVSPTGYFGPLTLQAVLDYQRSMGLAPTGVADWETRNRMLNDCNDQPYGVPVHITSMSPRRGDIDTEVTLYGQGFTRNNTVRFGDGGFNGIPSYDGTSLTFTVPESMGPYCRQGNYCILSLMMVDEGDYSVWVENTNGSSNAVVFTVTDDDDDDDDWNTTIAIDSLSAPSRLRIGETGSWNFDVVIRDNYRGDLHYSVDWDDDNRRSADRNAVRSRRAQYSTHFTHTYARSGTYTPTFTVTDDEGHSASVSATVRVNR